MDHDVDANMPKPVPRRTEISFKQAWGVGETERGRGNLSAIKSRGVCEFLSNTALVGTA